MNSINTIVENMTTYHATASNYTASLTSTWIPVGLSMFNKFLSPVKTASITNYATATTGDNADDEIISHLTAAQIDAEFNNLYVDPFTRVPINTHYETAKRMILDMYGVISPTGKVVMPYQMYAGSAYTAIGAIDSSQATSVQTTLSHPISMSYLNDDEDDD